MRVLAISGSLRAKSANTALVYALESMAPAAMEIIVYRGLGDLPHFNPDLDDDDPPIAVIELRAALMAADRVLFCTPEYAFGVPGVLKNALDWVVSSGELANKRVAVISASPSYMGGEKAHASLVLTLTAEAARVVEGGTLIIPAITKKLDATGAVADPSTARALTSLLAALARPDDDDDADTSAGEVM